MWWIVLPIGIVVAAIGYLVFGRRTDQAAPHEVVDRQGSTMADGQAQLPAEPGSEDQAVVGDGVTGPGPGAEPLES